MADNISAVDGTGSAITISSTDTGTAQVYSMRLADATAANFQLLGSATNVSAKSSVNAAQVVEPGQWTVNHTPATTVQATASKSAGGSGVRHVCTSISFSYCAGASAISAAAPLLVNLRDGATGAGTILLSQYVNVPAAAADCRLFSLSGLNVVGTANTAMTLEFSAGGGTNSYESVSITGYSCS